MRHFKICLLFGLLSLCLGFGVPVRANLNEARINGQLIQEADYENMARHHLAQENLLILAELLLQLYPPHEYDYVSLGRSGAGLALALEAVLAELSMAQPESSRAIVRELPFSGLRIESPFQIDWYQEPLREHFRRFLGDLSDRGRQIVIFDFAKSGATMTKFTRILEFAQKQEWVGDNIHLLALRHPSLSEKRLWQGIRFANEGHFPRAQWRSLELSPLLANIFLYSAFKDYADYRSWKFRDPDFEEQMHDYKYISQKNPEKRPPRSPGPLKAIKNLSLLDTLSLRKQSAERSAYLAALKQLVTERRGADCARALVEP